MAPIDISSAEAEVASNEEAVIIAEAAIESAQDQLRALVMNPSQPGFWNDDVPADATQPTLTPQAIDVDAAVKNALANRTDIQQFKKQMENTDVTVKFAQNQSCPASTCRARYGADRRRRHAGTSYDQDESGLPVLTGTVDRGFGSRAARRVRQRLPHLELRAQRLVSDRHERRRTRRSRRRGCSSSRSRRNARPTWRCGVTDAGPRRGAQGQHEPEAGRGDAQGARELAQQRLDAENKRFTVGLSTTFELIQAQRDLVARRAARAAREHRLQPVARRLRSRPDRADSLTARLGAPARQKVKAEGTGSRLAVAFCLCLAFCLLRLFCYTPVRAEADRHGHHAERRRRTSTRRWPRSPGRTKSSSSTPKAPTRRRRSRGGTARASRCGRGPATARRRTTPRRSRRTTGSCRSTPTSASRRRSPAEIQTLLAAEPRTARLPRAARQPLSRPLDPRHRLVSRLPAAPLRSPRRAVERPPRARIGRRSTASPGGCARSAALSLPRHQPSPRDDRSLHHARRRADARRRAARRRSPASRCTRRSPSCATTCCAGGSARRRRLDRVGAEFVLRVPEAREGVGIP